jgi:hypothetical protein
MDDNDKTVLEGLRSENRLLQVKVTLSEAALRLWMLGYDALLHHGVNMRTLKEFKDAEALDASDLKGNMEEGRNAIVGYLRRVEHAVTAAVRRKNMKQV